jgi:peptidoglycan hydrolase-like amidase
MPCSQTWYNLLIMPNTPKKIIWLFLSVITFTIILSRSYNQTFAEADCTSVEDCAKKLASTQSKLASIRSQQDSIDAQIKDYLSKLNVTDAQIESLKKDIAKVGSELKVIEENLADRRGSLGKKTQIRNTIVRDFYKFGQPSILEVLLSGADTWGGGQAFAVRDIIEDSVGRDAVKSIISLNMEIADFESDKKEASDLRASLESSQNKLLSLKADIDRKKAQAQTQVAELDKKGDSYEKTIAELSAKQQQILAEKSGSDSGSVGDYEPPKASLPTPKFSPAYAAISYGAYTHYKGMSQYGAKGRAEDGQDYKAILKFYYNSGVKKVSMPDITVSGVGKMSMQKYLYGIAEMPSTWPADALKAQAIAARSYAYRYAKDGKAICTTQSCQVFLKSKADSPPSAWKDAVNGTDGQILDSSVTAYYSSTTGGYIENIGWDSKGGWPNGAYEKRGGSPWFYKAWYTKSYNDSSTCGRPDPYLTQEEMADILNALTVWDKGSSSDRSRVSPRTTSCWGGSPYSLGDMKDRAEELGTAYSSVTSVDVEIGNNGQTTKVKFGTDKGSISVDGEKFKTVFNLRAPGYISIKDRLYEVVKK